MSKSLRGEVRHDAVVSAMIGLLLVVLLLCARFPLGAARAVLSLVPLALGILWMIGAMVALDLHLNFMNIFVITMIIGIGVDYGIHVIHRFLRGAATPRRRTRRTRWRRPRDGVFLAALTTMVGFGSLASSHYPGLVSMGLVSAPRNLRDRPGRHRSSSPPGSPGATAPWPSRRASRSDRSAGAKLSSPARSCRG